MFLKRMKIIFIAIGLSLFFTACSDDVEQTQNNESNEEVTYTVERCVYTDEFMSASSEIGLDVSKIKNLEFQGDWVGGSFYNFSYELNNGEIYCSVDNELDSINFSDVKVYSKGYEFLSLNDYLVNTQISDELTTITRSKVEDKLNNPDTANFISFGYAHWGIYYGVSGSVEAQNAFGVKKELKFNLIYNIEDNNSLVYFVLDNESIFGSMPDINPSRLSLDNSGNEVNNSEGSFVIEDGVLGEFGQKVTLDGDSYIWFYIPSGTYEVSCEVNFCKVYLDGNDTYKNSDGYTETKNITTLQFTKDSGPQSLEIPSNSHIEVTIAAKLKFVKK